jgi:phosphate transport system permease protein
VETGSDATTRLEPVVLLQRGFQGRLYALLAEKGIVSLLFLSASVAALATVAIFGTLVGNGWAFFNAVPLSEFLFGSEWAPDFLPPRFGMLPLLKGTLLIGLGAAVIGVPLGIGTAIYLSEFASQRRRSVLKPAIELLAGIPSIVFGIVALFTISPLLQAYFGAGVFSAANATVVLGIMVLPIITTLAEDALHAVPNELRQGALALGATRWETTWQVVVPAAASGIAAATLLGFSRAIGETMAVTLAAGLVPTMSLNFLDPTQTITAYVANRAGGDLPTGSVAYLSLFAIGAVLFVITFLLNVVAVAILAKQRRLYA